MKSALSTYETLEAQLHAAQILPRAHRLSPLSRDKSESPLCIYSLQGHLYLLLDAPRWPESPQLAEFFTQRKDHAVTWAIRWATAARSEDGMRILLSEGCRCGGDPSDRNMYSIPHFYGWLSTEKYNHGDGPTSPAWSPGEQLLSRSLEEFEALYLVDHPKTEVADDAYASPFLQLHQLSQRQRWPRSLSDLLPHGPTTSLESLPAWLTMSSLAPGVRARLLCVIARLTNQTFSIVTSSCLNSLKFLEALVLSTNILCSAIWDSAKVPTTSWRALKDHMRALAHVSCIFQNFVNYGMRSLRYHLFRPDKLEILLCCAHGHSASKQLLTILRKGSSSIPIEDVKSMIMCKDAAQRFTNLGGDMFDMAPELQFLPTVRSSDHVRSDFFDECETLLTFPSYMKDFHALQRNISVIAHEQICGHIDCRKTSADINREMPICGRCRMIKYCSRRCQKLAWLQAPGTHRDICSALVLLGSTLVVPRRRDVLRNRRDRFRVDMHNPSLKYQQYAFLIRSTVDRLDAWAALHHALQAAPQS